MRILRLGKVTQLHTFQEEARAEVWRGRESEADIYGVLTLWKYLFKNLYTLAPLNFTTTHVEERLVRT